MAFTEDFCAATFSGLNVSHWWWQVVEVLTESLTLPETPIPTKVARLMLVSDILHNSSAPVKNASAYRTFFQARLPDIFESFNETYKNVTGRMTAEALKVGPHCAFLNTKIPHSCVSIWQPPHVLLRHTVLVAGLAPGLPASPQA
jgi:hypothetical protein